MKYCAFILFSIFISCGNSHKDYEYILKSLEKNYVTIKNIPKKDILFCWNVNHVTFVNDSIEYRKGVSDFYKQQIPFIEYLLEKKNNGNKFNNWIVTKNPCSSNLKEVDFINNTKGSIILIDNLMLGNKKDIIVKDYINKINYEKLKSIMIKNKNKSFDDIKRDYIIYINEINKK